MPSNKPTPSKPILQPYVAAGMIGGMTGGAAGDLATAWKGPKR
jgi:hypothetical protein